MQINRPSTSIEKQINQIRIQKKLRIWFSDFEIYDMLGRDMTLPEIQRHASMAPTIQKLNLSNLKAEYPINSKDFTHVAIFKRREVVEKLVQDVYYMILTKRDIAIDRIESKMINGKYRLIVDVAQLSKQVYLWGAQVTSNKIDIVTPMFVHSGRAIWTLIYDNLDTSPKYLIFFSVGRKPAYGKKKDYGNELPKDVTRQCCMKFRSFESLTQYFIRRPGSEQKLEQIEERFIDNYHFQNKSLRQDNMIKEKQTANISKEKKKNALRSDKQHKTIHHKPRQNELVIEQVKIIFQPYPEYTTSLSKHLQHLNRYQQSLQSEYEQWINSPVISDEEKGERQAFSLISLANMESIDEKIQFYERAMAKYEHILSSLILIHMIKEETRAYPQFFHLKFINWLKLYYYINDPVHNFMAPTVTTILNHFFIYKCQLFIKKSQSYIVNLKDILRDQLIPLIMKALEYHSNNSAMSSELLVLLMRVQNKKNILRLYYPNRLIEGRVILCESIMSWLDRQKIPNNSDKNLVIKIEQICVNMLDELQPIQQEDKNYSFLAEQQNRLIHFELVLLSEWHLFTSKRMYFKSKVFKFFLFRKKHQLYCFIEEDIDTRQKQTNKSSHSYNILIDIKVNKIAYQHAFGWNFTLPSHSIGFKLAVGYEQILYIQCEIYMKKQMIHSAIFNHLRARYSQMLHFPLYIQHEENSRQNQCLSHRTSTLDLQEQLLLENRIIEVDCYFHKECKDCYRKFDMPSIFNLTQLDMLSFLFGLPFNKEHHFLMVLFKYHLVNNTMKECQLMSRTVRLDFLQGTKLFDFLNTYKLDSTVRQFFKKLIEGKVNYSQMVLNSNQQEIYPFRSRVRVYEQICKLRDGAFYEQYFSLFLREGPRK